jgi:DNA repair and recombination RAD54-like protein
MRKSLAPSRLAAAVPAAPVPSSSSVGGTRKRSIVGASGGGGGMDVDEAPPLRREAWVPGLYSKDDLTDRMQGRLHDVHAAFKRPTQDVSKVQLWDPDRATKRLGMCKVGAGQRRLPSAVLALPTAAPAPGAAEEEKWVYEPLILWSPPEEIEGAAVEEVKEAAGEEVAGEEAEEGAAAVEEGVCDAGDGVEGPPSKVSKKVKAPRPKPIEVDGFICRFLRSHQREGTQFLFDCTMGQREYDGCGCILADDMGLGKTLQSITILWTLMTQGMDGKPAVTHTIVACPVSLVTNWESELRTKWVGEERLRRAGIDVVAVAEAKKEEIKGLLRRFTFGRSAILIISYETFRLHEKAFRKGNQCGLLICDEAHRLKNKDTKTAIALANLSTRRRILLSGTPIQNDLDEFYSMVHFANPGLLGTQHDFHKLYQNPILRGREPGCSDKERLRGEEKSGELGRIVNQFILRRTNTLLSEHLPPKLVVVACCSLSDLQLRLYAAYTLLMATDRTIACCSLADLQLHRCVARAVDDRPIASTAEYL